MSERANRLFVQGKPMGCSASLSAQRSTITHVAAMCDRPDFHTRLPQVGLVGANQVTEERLARLRLGAPACVRIWRYPKAWMSTSVMVRYLRLRGMCLQEFPKNISIHSVCRRAEGTHQPSGCSSCFSRQPLDLCDPMAR